jgi:glycosyltransferase involved in cell wall biosynthesis
MPTRARAVDDPSLVNARLDLLDATATWFVRAAERDLDRGDLESCLRNAHVAASLWMRQNRQLTVPRLESLIQHAAQRLDAGGSAVVAAASMASIPPTASKCLHVMEEAMPAGGLTAMATRWIRNDGAARSHSVALLAQKGPVPKALEEAVAASGGRIVHAPSGAGLAERARWLRALCRQGPRVVVAHVGVSDVVFPTALGVAGGPPVMLVNHAAHIFWVGSTVVDLVVNCRGSRLEEQWSRRHRGAPCAAVPIPLDEPAPGAARAADARAAARLAFGVAPDARVMLTVGAGFKFGPTRTLDFVAAMEEVLHRVPEAVLIAAGVSPDERWRAASERTQGRLRAIGPIAPARVRGLHAIADVYVEGFPFGTTTSLLEAGSSGMAAVLAPAAAPPPYGTDGVAIDDVLERPADVRAAQEMLVGWLADAPARERVGARLAESIRSHHIGTGWHAHLTQALRELPESHRVRSPCDVDPVPCGVHEHWADFMEHSGSRHAEVVEHAIVRARLMGLRPRPDADFLEALHRAAPLRQGVGVPTWLLRAALGAGSWRGALSLVPHALGTRLFRAIAWWSRRRGLLEQRRATALTPGTRRSWYDQYRDIEA